MKTFLTATCATAVLAAGMTATTAHSDPGSGAPPVDWVMLTADSNTVAGTAASNLTDRSAVADDHRTPKLRPRNPADVRRGRAEMQRILAECDDKGDRCRLHRPIWWPGNDYPTGTASEKYELIKQKLNEGPLIVKEQTTPGIPGVDGTYTETEYTRQIVATDLWDMLLQEEVDDWDVIQYLTDLQYAVHDKVKDVIYPSPPPPRKTPPPLPRS